MSMTYYEKIHQAVLESLPSTTSSEIDAVLAVIRREMQDELHSAPRLLRDEILKYFTNPRKPSVKEAAEKYAALDMNGIEIMREGNRLAFLHGAKWAKEHPEWREENPK